MHLEAVIVLIWRCTWRQWSIDIGGVLVGNVSWDFIHWLTRICGNVQNWAHQGPPRDGRPAVSRKQSIMGWCSTWCMQYSVYAVVSGNSWSWHGERERDDLILCSYVMVELRTRTNEIRGDGGNHDEKLGLKWNLCASQFTIADTAGTSPHPAGINGDKRCSNPNRATRPLPFSYPLVSSISVSSSSAVSLARPQLYHHRRTQIYIIPLYLTTPWSRGNTEYSIYQGQHYTECSIHQVQLPLEMVCGAFILTITSWPLNVPSPSWVPPSRLTNTRPQSI